MLAEFRPLGQLLQFLRQLQLHDLRQFLRLPESRQGLLVPAAGIPPLFLEIQPRVSLAQHRQYRQHRRHRHRKDRAKVHFFLFRRRRNGFLRGFHRRGRGLGGLHGGEGLSFRLRWADGDFFRKGGLFLLGRRGGLQDHPGATVKVFRPGVGHVGSHRDRLPRPGLDHIAGDIPGRNSGRPQQHRGRGGEMDAVAPVAFFQKPSDKILIIRRHFGGFPVIDRGISDVFGNRRRSFGIGFTVRRDLKDQILGPLGIQRQCPVDKGIHLPRLSHSELDLRFIHRGRRRGLGQREGIFRQAVGIADPAAYDRLAFLGIIGQIQHILDAPGLNGHSLPGGIPAAEFLPPTLPGSPAGAAVDIIVLAPEVHRAGPGGGHLHHRVTPAGLGPHRPQVHIPPLIAPQGDVQPQLPGWGLLHHRQTGRQGHDLIQMRPGVVYITFFRNSPKQQSQGCRRGQQQKDRLAVILSPGPPPGMGGKNQQQKPQQKQVQKERRRDGVRHHQGGDQGDRRQDRRQNYDLAALDRPNRHQDHRHGGDPQR